jgi:cation diffusion facilitator CzcD-associated flavoprotein CzcO
MEHFDINFPFEHAEGHPKFMDHFIDGSRPLKIINIGAGYTGLMACIRIPRKFKSIDFVCYEKNHDVGGTWLANTYPGVACDMQVFLL